MEEWGIENGKQFYRTVPKKSFREMLQTIEEQNLARSKTTRVSAHANEHIQHFERAANAQPRKQQTLQPKLFDF